MTTLTKEERIKREKNKLVKQFKGLDEKRRKAVEKTIENAAWLSITLEDLRSTIDANGDTGLVIEYKNGENQYGYKKSPEIEIYNQTLANYMKIVTQLNAMLPAEVKLNKNDKDLADIKEFIHQ